MIRKLSLKELCVFSMLGVIMFCSKLILDALPNIHLIGALIVSYTVAFRTRALVPIYVFVFLSGIYGGFMLWWVPYLYIWTVLWAVTMILPKKMPKAVAVIVYIAVCSLHGLLFGTLYAPFQALAFGLDWDAIIAWIIAGLPFDVIHAISNALVGILIVPISSLLIKLDKNIIK